MAGVTRQARPRTTDRVKAAVPGSRVTRGQRDPAGRRPPSREWLDENYVGRQRSTVQLADDTGWSSQYIRDRLRDAGIDLRPTGTRGTKRIQLNRDLLEAMLGQGMTVAAIAERAGYGPGGVYRLLRQHGLSTPGRPVTELSTDPVTAECGQMYRRGDSLRAIGHRFGHGQDWARTRVCAAGVSLRRAAPAISGLKDQALQAALDRGATVADLAARFDRSQDTVRAWLRQAGITPPAPPPRTPPPPLDGEQLRRLYIDEQLIITEIAGRLDVPRHRVRDGLSAAGIPTHRGRRRNAITAAQLQELYVDEELSVAELATRLHVSAVRVRAALRRHGIAPRPRAHAQLPAFAVDAETLRRMHVDGRLNDDEIAAHYGVPPYRVRSRRRALQVTREPSPPPHPPPPAVPDRDQLRQMYCDQARTLVDIARSYHTSSPAVAQWLRDAGITVRERTKRTHRRQLDVDQLRLLYADREWTAPEIAAELDTTIQLVLRTLHDNGIPVRRSGSRRRLAAANEDAEQLIDALYDDPTSNTGFTNTTYRSAESAGPSPSGSRTPSR